MCLQGRSLKKGVYRPVFAPVFSLVFRKTPCNFGIAA